MLTSPHLMTRCWLPRSRCSLQGFPPSKHHSHWKPLWKHFFAHRGFSCWSAPSCAFSADKTKFAVKGCTDTQVRKSCQKRFTCKTSLTCVPDIPASKTRPAPGLVGGTHIVGNKLVTFEDELTGRVGLSSVCFEYRISTKKHLPFFKRDGFSAHLVVSGCSARVHGTLEDVFEMKWNNTDCKSGPKNRNPHWCSPASSFGAAQPSYPCSSEFHLLGQACCSMVPATRCFSMTVEISFTRSP